MPGQVIANTSYDSDKNRDYCAKKGIEVVIPNRTEPAPFDEEQYRRFYEALTEAKSVPLTSAKQAVELSEKLKASKV